MSARLAKSAHIGNPNTLCYNVNVTLNAGRLHARKAWLPGGAFPKLYMEVGIMSVKQPIKCNCGQRIVTKDVMQTGYYLRLFGPSFVYVKFRCSRCKKLGEQFVKQEDWEDGILNDIPPEISDLDKDRLVTMGPISIDEQIDFHFALDDDESLRDLIEQAKAQFQPAEDTEDSKTQ